MDEGLVDRIYEAGAVPELWTGVLEELGRLAGGIGAVLVVPALGRWIATSGVEAMISDLVNTGLISTNERTKRLLAMDRAGFVTDQDVFPIDQIPSQPVYRDFFIPRGGGFGVATVIPSPSGDTMIFHAERAFAAGPVGDESVAALDQLRPHLARASLLSSRLELHRATAAATALEILGLPGAVLGRGGRVMFANSLLDAFVPTVVQDRRSRLALFNIEADRLLDAALGRLVDRNNNAISSIPIPAQDGQPPLIVHVVPIRGAAHDVFASGTAIVVVTPVVPKNVPSAEVVQGLFDLTPAEARVAREIGRGKTVAEIATVSGLSSATLRSQVKAILGKTGLHRQAELIGLLRGIPAISPPGGDE